MKKIKQILVTSIVAFSFAFTPMVALAQDSEVPTVEVQTTTPSTTSTTDTTDETDSTAGVPETGIAPEPSYLVRNIIVFVVGGSIGAAAGLGIVTLKKRKSQN